MPPTAHVAMAASGLLLLAGVVGCSGGHRPAGAGAHAPASAGPGQDTSTAPGSTMPTATPRPSASGTTRGTPSHGSPAGGNGGGGTIPASFPSAANTGIPAGHKLTVHNGTLTVSKAGTVIDGVEVHGDVSVTANNVTIKNSRVITAGDWGIIQRKGVSGLKVLDSEVHGDGRNALSVAVLNQGGMLTVQRCDFSIVSNGIQTTAGLLTDNYIHDPTLFSGDHVDMIQSDSGPSSGQRLVIRHNTLINTKDQTSVIALFQNFGVQHDAVIDGNLLAGGGYTLYGGRGSEGTAYNIVVTNNVFSRQVFPKGGYWGPIAYWDKAGSGNLWQNNVWQDTHGAVSP